MYSVELLKYISDRNFSLTGEEVLFATDINEHPQLQHIKYDAYDNNFQMWDKEGNYYYFSVK